MSPTRRQVVNAIAAGAVVPVTVASAEAQEQDNQDFSPDITIHSNNLVATIGARDGDVDPDTVSITTADGQTHEFDGAAPEESNAGYEFDVGYTNGDSRARIAGSWHGVIREVTATRGDESVTESNDRASSLEVSCSMWQSPDEPPRHLAVVSEGASLQFRNHSDDEQRRYGSRGRSMQTVVEHHPDHEMQVDFEGCPPSSEKAVRFNCTSVTIEEEELVRDGNRIDDVRLEFTDGSGERPPGTADDAENGAYELPVTLEGSGDNAGKVIERLHFKALGDEYSYRNLDAEDCTAETNSEEGSQENDDTAEQEDGNDAADDSTDSDSTSDDSTNGDSTDRDGASDDGSSGGSQPSSDSTSGQDSTDDGSTSGGRSGGATSRQSSAGGSTGSDPSADGTATPTPDSDTSTVSVNRTEEEIIQLNTSSTPESAASTNASRTNAAAEASNDPATATATSKITDASPEDQPGLGFVSGLGGLLGFGELARRRLGRDDDEA